MRRFVTFVFLLFFTIPFGVSIAGCSKSSPVTYCNGGSTGPQVGQLFSIALEPKLYGISLNYGEMGQVSSPSSTDCKGTAVSAGAYTYGTTDMSVADIVPSSGRLCAGTWNRNSGGGVPDYTTCNKTNKGGTAYITASAGGATSNPIAIYIHPIVTSMVLGAPSTDCIHDPATNCSISLQTSCTLNSDGCSAVHGLGLPVAGTDGATGGACVLRHGLTTSGGGDCDQRTPVASRTSAAWPDT